MQVVMDPPKSIVVETATFHDGDERPFSTGNTQFFVTVPGLPDGRPFVFCEYKYRTSMEKKTVNGVVQRTYKLFWEPTTWLSYNPLIRWTAFATLNDPRVIAHNAYWANYIKCEPNKPTKQYPCYST